MEQVGCGKLQVRVKGRRSKVSMHLDDGVERCSRLAEESAGMRSKMEVEDIEAA